MRIVPFNELRDPHDFFELMEASFNEIAQPDARAKCGTLGLLKKCLLAPCCPDGRKTVCASDATAAVVDGRFRVWRRTDSEARFLNSSTLPIYALPIPAQTGSSRTANRSILPHGIVPPNPGEVKRNEKWSCGPAVKWSSERNRRSGALTCHLTLPQHAPRIPGHHIAKGNLS